MRNDNSLAIIAIVLSFLAIVVIKFSAILSVNFETGLSILLRIIIVTAIATVCVKSDLMQIGAIIPAICAGLVWAFFPALDYWSVQTVGNFGFGLEFYESAWYARWHSKALFMLTPIFVGYAIRYFISR